MLDFNCKRISKPTQPPPPRILSNVTGDEEVVHITEQVTKDSPAGKSLVMASLELSKVHITVQSFWEVTKKDKAFKANDRDQDWR